MAEHRETELVQQIDNSRRTIALGLLGALGGSALLKGCASADDRAGSATQSPSGLDIGVVQSALTGTTGLRWFDKMNGTVSDPGLADYSLASANDIAILLGYYTPGDGGGGVFFWDATSTTASDGGVVIGSAAVGRWKRILTDHAHRNAKWFGAKGDGTTNDQPALQACINSAFGFGADIYIPYGTYRCNSTLKMRYEAPAGPNYNCRLRGDGYGGYTHGGTKIIWGGSYSSSAVLFQAGAPDCTFEFLEFSDSSSAESPTATQCAVLVNVGGSPGETAYNTHMNFRHCNFIGGDYCIVFDYNQVATGNSEDSSFKECAIQSGRYANIWLRSTPQPYNTVFDGCYITNFLPRAIPGAPAGVGLLCDTESATITMMNCDIQRVAVHMILNKAPQSTVIMNCHSEVVKKLLIADIVYFTNSTINIIGGRYTVDGVGVASEGPLSSFPANDYNFIEARCALPITIIGVQFNEGYLPTANWFISLIGNDLISRGNRYPNLRPFKRLGYGYSQSWAKCRGRTFSEGDLGADASGNPVKLPVLKGCENGGGRVTISGAAQTFAAVTFDREEAYADQFGAILPLEYNVNLAIRSVTGTFTVPVPYLSNMTKDGFRITIPAPVGAGNSIEISYDIWSGGYNT